MMLAAGLRLTGKRTYVGEFDGGVSRPFLKTAPREAGISTATARDARTAFPGAQSSSAAPTDSDWVPDWLTPPVGDGTVPRPAPATTALLSAIEVSAPIQASAETAQPASHRADLLDPSPPPLPTVGPSGEAFTASPSAAPGESDGCPTGARSGEPAITIPASWLVVEPPSSAFREAPACPADEPSGTPAIAIPSSWLVAEPPPAVAAASEVRFAQGLPAVPLAADLSDWAGVELRPAAPATPEAIGELDPPGSLLADPPAFRTPVAPEPARFDAFSEMPAASVRDVIPATTRTSRTTVEPIGAGRVARAKPAFTARRVPSVVIRTLVTGAVRPRAGDLVLARVDRLGQHPRIELPSGRKAALHPGDEIIVVCGNRYASDQFEAFVPPSLGSAHLVASGGVAARVVHRARRIRQATEITLLGALGNADGEVLNLAAFPIASPRVERRRPPVIAVFGTAMNSGKTTSAGALIQGLTATGARVGYAKLTGTGSGNDFWAMVDSGAAEVVDFTDAGLVSTYLTPIHELERTSLLLLGHLTGVGCDAIVVEIADGLLQKETAALLKSSIFHELIDRVVFAAVDAMAAAGGVTMLQEAGFQVVGVSGLLTASPLPLSEARQAVAVPVFTRDDLTDGQVASGLLPSRASGAW